MPHREASPSDLSLLIVDDSAVFRRILRDVVAELPGVRLAGVAHNGQMAIDRIRQHEVDFVLLDNEMPVMNGLETLEVLRKDHPDVGVVMVSACNKGAADVTMEALQRGALEFIAKPDRPTPAENRAELSLQIKGILRTFRTRQYLRQARRSAGHEDMPGPRSKPPVPRRPPPTLTGTGLEVIVIGVSTGGPNALAQLIPRLPADLGVPVLIVQHMPPVFTASLANSLDRKSALKVTEAVDGEPIQPGRVYIAPGGRHMVTRCEDDEEGYRFVIGLNDSPPERSCRPSADVLFRSVANTFEGRALGVIMTGMGDDGCRGVRTLKQRGARILTQDQASCVVYGMPAAVDQAGLSDESLPLETMARRIHDIVRRTRGPAILRAAL